ncbi:MAG: hypothetical protein E3J36_00615 [Candidatus Nealsonbacteria bacterium]|nr:MAG: hypothetical protein E3J36_00615 [Candidatus Nealsonbacteria bacterium]
MAIIRPPVFNKGLSIIEILIVIAIIGFALVSILGLVSLSLKTSTSIKEITQANALAQEAMEAIRNFRDGTEWDTNGLRDHIEAGATTSDPYRPELDNNFDPPKWILVEGEETIGDFTRKVVFKKVSRDPLTQNIEPTYNEDNDDSDTRKVEATVSWKNENKKIKLVTYLTNWKQ